MPACGGGLCSCSGWHHLEGVLDACGGMCLDELTLDKVDASQAARGFGGV
jgi:hypothetical protein